MKLNGNQVNKLGITLQKNGTGLDAVDTFNGLAMVNITEDEMMLENGYMGVVGYNVGFRIVNVKNYNYVRS